MTDTILAFFLHNTEIHIITSILKNAEHVKIFKEQTKSLMDFKYKKLKTYDKGQI